MTRIAKLYDKLLDGRPLSFVEFRRLIEAFGFELDRVRGSHHIFRRPGLSDRLNVQPQGNAAKPYQVDQFIDIIEAYGLTLDDAK